jgi:hypothetical protein
MTSVCEADGCEEPAAVRIYDPRGADREVCVACARSLSQRQGVVAAPLEDADAEWP